MVNRGVGVAAIALAILFMAIGCSRQLEDNNASGKYLELAKSAIVESTSLFRNRDSKCELQDNHLRYTGETNVALIECLSTYPDVKSLIITSIGGSVQDAIIAANLVSERKIDLSVLGLCASSCGNYIVPAANSVVVEPYSMIRLHGAPQQDEEIVRVSLMAALKKLNPEKEYSEEYISEQMENLLSDRHKHDAFVTQFGIGELWYTLDFYYDKIHATPVDQQGALIVSKRFLKACNPDLEIISFWEPASRAEVDQLTIVDGGGPLWIMGKDIENPVGC